MARTPDDVFHGQADSQHSTHLDAASGDTLALPGGMSVSDAEILRDGQDLILRTPDGRETIVDNYFTADPAPVIVSADGAALTPALADSFAKPVDGVQFAQKGSVDDASPVGVVKEVSGDATITHANGITEKAAIGTPIYEGDIVETKGDGAVNITFVDDTTFAVSENARLAIDEYVFDPATQSGENNFSVLRGVFVFTSGLIGRDDPDDVKIDTPVGSIGIRGTTIMGNINPDGESQITVVEGAIVVTNAQGEKTLSQQFETVKLNGFNDPMGEAAVLDSTQVAEDYTVVRTVAAPLFSTFDDMGDTKADPADEDAPADTAPDAEKSTAPAQDENAPAAPVETDPAHKTDAAPADAQETTEQALLDVNLESSLDQAGFDSGFDTSAGLTPSGGFDSAAAGTSSGATAASITGGGNAPAFTAPASPAGTAGATDPGVVPPPAALNNNGGNTTAPGGGTTTPPIIMPTHDLDLNAVIGSNAGGTFIPTLMAGSRHGDALAVLGDVDHDGLVDYAFASQNPSGGRLYVDDVHGNNHEVYLASTPHYMNDTTNLSITGVGDFNGDGIGDIAVGSPISDDSGQINSGKIVLMSGTNPNAAHNITITGFNAGQFAGFDISGGGDFNGDGLNDLIIGAPYDAGTGRTYVIFGTSGATNIDVSALTPAQGFVLNGTTGARSGSDVAMIGDFNRDGYSDFATATPGTGSVQVYFGNQYGVANAPLTINGLTPQTGGNDIHVDAMGDINGDGIADLGVADAGTNTLHIFYGGAHSPGTINATASNLKITSAAGSEIIAGNAAGDFNGDGYGDGVVAVRTGSTVEVYVFYGRPGTIGTLDLSTAPDNSVFKMSLDLTNAQFSLNDPLTDEVDIKLSSAGDLNGDGYDDLVIGIPTLGDDSGGVVIVYGRAEGADLTNGSVQEANIATAAGQSLLGGAGNDVMQNTFANVYMDGGAGNDTLQLDGGSLRGVDGGTGIDTLSFMQSGANIDLRALGENVTGIERMALNGSTQQLTIGIDQIFRLLQESETGDLQFTSMTSGALQIDNNGNGATSMAGLGFTDQGTSGGVTEWSFGEYSVYIDTNTNVTVANV